MFQTRHKELLILSKPTSHPPSPFLPPFLFSTITPPLPLPQQSLNDKRKKNLFSRKFPFYKSKEASEQETSDVDRKYQRGGGGAGGLSERGLAGDRKRDQLVAAC